MLSSQIAPVEAEWLAVSDVTYAVHKKVGKADSLKAMYRCGMVMHTEWVAFEAQGFARRKAESWWARRGGNPLPATTAIAHERASVLRKPQAIKVIPDGRYVRVIDYRFADEERMRA